MNRIFSIINKGEEMNVLAWLLNEIIYIVPILIFIELIYANKYLKELIKEVKVKKEEK